MKRFNREQRVWVGAAAAALLVIGLVAAPAAAHVTVQPTESSTGAFERFVVRVPNEHESAATIKIEVQMPDSFEEVRYQPKEGWTRTVTGRTVVWEGGRIAHGEFDEFGFSTRMPDDAGVLVFPSIQTYDNGEVVSWTGPEDADKPAGRVTVSEAPADAVEVGDDAGDEDAQGGDDQRGVAWAALALSVLALLLAGAGVLRGRRP